MVKTFGEVMAAKGAKHFRDIHHPCTRDGRKWREEGYQISQELHPKELYPQEVFITKNPIPPINKPDVKPQQRGGVTI